MGVEDNWPYGQEENASVDTTPCEVPECSGTVPEDEVEGRYCHGCGATICSKHDDVDVGWGGHRPRDHNVGEETSW